MLKPRKDLEKNLVEVINETELNRTRNRHNRDIKHYLLSEHQILEGDVQGWLDNPEEELQDLDIRELFLLTEQIYLKTEKEQINPTKYFTKNEAKEARQYSGMINKEKLEFPITIPNAQVVGNGAYMVTLSIKQISQLIDNQLLNYNFDLQREAKIVKRKNQVMLVPKLVTKNVKEITNHLLEGTLVPTTLVFNAATRTADSGTELVYDARKMELTITKGTRLDIIDGYHRCKASQNALKINPDLNFNFAVLITNYNTRKAQQYQAQLAKATPISRVRVQELEANRLADIVVQQLKEESDLKGRVSQTKHAHYINNELVSYNVLADTIDEVFNLETRAQAADVGDFLVEFFNYLLDGFKNEFIDNPNEVRKKSLINNNNMFAGYIVLASRMFEKKIKPRKVVKILSKIDFSKENKLWVDIGVYGKDKKIRDTLKAREAIKKYFMNIELDIK